MCLQILKNPNFIRHEIFVSCRLDAADETVICELHGDLPLTARVLINGGIDDTAMHGTADRGDDIEGDDSDIIGTSFFDECLTDTVCTARGGNEEGVDLRVLLKHFESAFIRLYVVVKTYRHRSDRTVLFCRKAFTEGFDAVHMSEHTDTAVDHARVYGTRAKLAQECRSSASSRSIVTANVDVRNIGLKVVIECDDKDVVMYALIECLYDLRLANGVDDDCRSTLCL